jgi:hypothetical protein
VAVGKTIMVIVGAILKFKNRWTENFWNCPKDGNLFRLFGHTIPFYVRLVIFVVFFIYSISRLPYSSCTLGIIFDLRHFTHFYPFCGYCISLLFPSTLSGFHIQVLDVLLLLIWFELRKKIPYIIISIHLASLTT